MSIHELQARLKALDEHPLDWPLDAITALIEAARRVAEGAGEPVAWRWPGGAWQDGEPFPFDRAELKAAGVTPEFAYATPQAAQVPEEGYALVPVEPTEAMLDVMHERVRILCNPAEKSASIRNDREVWAAMLAAAQAQEVANG